MVMLGGTAEERGREGGGGGAGGVGSNVGQTHTYIRTYTPQTIVKTHSQGTNTVSVNVWLAPTLFLATTLTG